MIKTARFRIDYLGRLNNRLIRCSCVVPTVWTNTRYPPFPSSDTHFRHLWYIEQIINLRRDEYCYLENDHAAEH